MAQGIGTHLTGRQRRRLRVRKRVFGTAARPRLSVFRSARHIYAQVIDDERGVTLAAASSQGDGPAAPASSPVDDGVARGNKARLAGEVGRRLAGLCLERSIGQVVFDRNGYRYHGRVQAVAEAARAGGLKF